MNILSDSNKKKLAVYITLVAILFASLNSCPAFAQQPIDNLIEKAKSQTITLPELAARVLDLAEVDQSLVQEPDRLVLQFNGFADIFGAAVVSKVENLLRENNTAGAEQLREFTLRILGDKSKYSQQVVRLCDLNFRLKNLIARGTIADIKGYRSSLQSAVEKELFLPQLEKFVTSNLLEKVKQDSPIVGLKNLIEISSVDSSEEVSKTAAGVVYSADKLSSQGKVNYSNWNLEEASHLSFFVELSKKYPKLTPSIFSLLSGRLLWLVRNQKWKESSDLIEAVSSRWPQATTELSEMKKTAIASVSGPEGKKFAEHLVLQLEKDGRLSISDKFKLALSGYYGGTLIKVVTGVFIVLFLTLVGLLVAGRFFPGVAALFDRGGQKLDKIQQDRMIKKAQKRGVGYVVPVAEDDEYTKLLKTFGLDDSATESDIKKAYRKLVKEHHPDAHGAAGVVKNSGGDIDRTFEDLKRNYEKLLSMRGSFFGSGR